MVSTATTMASTRTEVASLMLQALPALFNPWGNQGLVFAQRPDPGSYESVPYCAAFSRRMISSSYTTALFLRHYRLHVKPAIFLAAGLILVSKRRDQPTTRSDLSVALPRPVPGTSTEVMLVTTSVARKRVEVVAG